MAKVAYQWQINKRKRSTKGNFPQGVFILISKIGIVPNGDNYSVGKESTLLKRVLSFR